MADGVLVGRLVSRHENRCRIGAPGRVVDRQHQLPAVDGQGRRRGRGDDIRPVGACQRESQDVTWDPLPRDRVDLDVDVVHLTGDEGFRRRHPAAPGQVQKAARNQRRRTVRRHVAQPGGDGGDRFGRRKPQPHNRMPGDLQTVGERPVPGQRPDVIGALVVGLTPRQVSAAGQPRGEADIGDHLVRRLRRQRPGLLAGAWRRPLVGAPHAGDLVEVGRGPVGGLRVPAHGRRLSVGSAATQPAVPPRDHLR